MAKKKQKQQSRNLMRYISAHRYTVTAVLIFIAVFSFIGAYQINNSTALGNTGYYCPLNDYFQYNPPYHYQVCVAEIQNMLNFVGSVQYYYGYSRLTVDGKFGPATATQVSAFQKYTHQYPQYIKGAVLSWPQYNGYWSGWRVLCGYDYASNGNRASTLWNQTGCDRIPFMPFN